MERKKNKGKKRDTSINTNKIYANLIKVNHLNKTGFKNQLV